jgi:2-polyprenyl-6-methoxyphenol hydroxylase-like FAD-dependent oxidoreductase
MTDALVAGGGFAGLVAARALSWTGLNVAVLEARTAPLPAFRGELLHPPAVRTLEALGLLTALRNAGGVDIEGFAAFDAAGCEVRLPYARGRGLALEHNLLVQTLRDELRRDGVRIVEGFRVEAVLSEAGRAVGLRATDGREMRARLIVAADGRSSKIRGMLGLRGDTTLASYSVAVALDGMPVAAPGYGHVFTAAPGPVLAYPFARNGVRMCIDVPRDIPRGRGPLAEYLLATYAPHLPEPTRSALEGALAQGDFEVCANHVVATAACAVKGAVLLGDAGGCSHPLTATGMTAALHDAQTLAAVVRQRGVGDDALLAYQRRRYRYVRAREIFAQALYIALRGQGQGAAALREGVFEYWRGGTRERAASMSILAGDESSPAAFAREYSTVLAVAARGVGADLVHEGPAYTARTLRDLGSVAAQCFKVAYGRAWATLSNQGVRELATVPAARATMPEAAAAPSSATSSGAAASESSRGVAAGLASGRAPALAAAANAGELRTLRPRESGLVRLSFFYARPRQRRAKEADYALANDRVAVRGGDAI